MYPFKNVFSTDLRDCLTILDKTRIINTPVTIQHFSEDLNFSKLTVIKRIQYINSLAVNAIIYVNGTIFPNHTFYSAQFAAYEQLISDALEFSLVKEFEKHPHLTQRDFSIKYKSSDPTVSNKVAKINKHFCKEMVIFEKNTTCMKERLDFLLFCLLIEQNLTSLSSKLSFNPVSFSFPFYFTKAVSASLNMLPKKNAKKTKIKAVCIKDRSHPFNFLKEFFRLNDIHQINFRSTFSFLLTEQTYINDYQKNIAIIYVYFMLIDHYHFSCYQMINLFNFPEELPSSELIHQTNPLSTSKIIFDQLNRLYQNEQEIRYAF